MLEFDTSELISKLGLPGPVRCTEIVVRRGKGVWRVDCPSGSFALRVFRPGQTATPLHEREMMGEARRFGLPVPAVHAVSSVGTRPVLLADWCPGEALSYVLRARPWLAVQLGRLFGEQHAKLHLSSIQNAPTYEWIDFFQLADDNLRDRLRTAQSHSTIIHLDYHPGNVMIEHGAISAILDWTNARFGDPRADLARSWAMLRFGNPPLTINPVRRVAQRLFENGWWQAYLRIAGAQSEMPLFLTWALMGVLRNRTRQATSARTEDLLPVAQAAAKLRTRAGLPFLAPEAVIDHVLGT